MHGFTACRDSLNAKMYCKQEGTECNDVQYARMYYTQVRGSTVCTMHGCTVRTGGGVHSVQYAGVY